LTKWSQLKLPMIPFRERIGGFPQSAQEFLDEQKAYAQFGRADHQTQEWPPQRSCVGMNRPVVFRVLEYLSAGKIRQEQIVD
jgi:hypothetical protein